MKKSSLADVELLVLDVDGVLTDGTLIINTDGSESKFFNSLDGHGIRMWHRAGLLTAIISGRRSEATGIRAAQLEITHVFQGCHDKLPAFEKLLGRTGLSASEAVYIGDDVLDIPIMRRVGFAVAAANAVDELKGCCHYITSSPGGGGAVREVVEYILKNTGRWNDLMQRYLV